MRSQEEFNIVRQLVAAGLSDRLISELTQIPRCTIRDWRLGRHCNERRSGASCDDDPEVLPPEQYAYLLGAYLGDGCISDHPRGVFRLRITCDIKYPSIIAAIRDAMGAARGHGLAGVCKRQSNCADVRGPAPTVR